MSKELKLQPPQIEISTHGRPPLTRRQKIGRTAVALLAPVTLAAGAHEVHSLVASQKESSSSVIPAGTPTTVVTVPAGGGAEGVAHLVDPNANGYGKDAELQELESIANSQATGRSPQGKPELLAGQQVTEPILPDAPKQ